MNEGFPEDDSAAQHQDQLEKEERLTRLLRAMLWLANSGHSPGGFSSKGILGFTEDDVDFVAAALGLSNYRK